MNAPQQPHALATREQFNGQEQTLAVTETAGTAMAAQARAMVESRYVMAMRNRRNWDQVRQDLMNECRRPGFADNKSSYYRKPIGKGVEGLGIRFAEVALRCMTNVLVETTMVFIDDAKEVHRVSVTDLEANVTYPLDVIVTRTVERSQPMDDGSYISVRKNIYGKMTYTVPGTDDDILNKRGALISKAVRTLALRIVPGDLQDEAIEIIKQIRLDKAAADPTAERKKIADGFGEIGVKAVDLTEYLGHSLDTCSPPELVQLRALYGAIRDGEATWKEAMDNKARNADGDGGNGGGDEKKYYDAELFAKNLPKWRDLILAGKKNADSIIAMAQTKAPLTDAQLKEIRAIVRKPTGKEVEDKLRKADGADVLAVAADLIKEVDDEAERTRLTAIYGELQQQFTE